MILNSKIFAETIAAAVAAVAGNAAMLRAIQRAVFEIERSAYWSFDQTTGTLLLQSTTSGHLYKISEAEHTCEARSKTCKHFVARKLLARYFQRVDAAESCAPLATQPDVNTSNSKRKATPRAAH